MDSKFRFGGWRMDSMVRGWRTETRVGGWIIDIMFGGGRKEKGFGGSRTASIFRRRRTDRIFSGSRRVGSRFGTWQRRESRVGWNRIHFSSCFFSFSKMKM